MLVRRSLFALLALFLMCGSLTAQADKAADAKKYIQSALKKEEAAFKKKDVKGILAHYAPEFVYTGKTGTTMKLDAIRNSMTQAMRLVTDPSTSVKINKFALKGNQAIVTVTAHTEMTVTNPQTNQPMKIVSDATSEESWKNSGKKWLRIKSRVLKETQTLNGKPVQR